MNEINNENIRETKFKQKNNHAEVIWGLFWFAALTVGMFVIAHFKGM